MPIERDLAGVADLTDTLRAATAALESLKRSREEIAKLVRFGRSRPSWQPECPLLVYDEDLVRRLDMCADRIDEARKRLIDKRADLLCDAQLRSPFVCPSGLQERIDYLDLLCSHARSRNLQDFLTVYNRDPVRDFLGPELRACVLRFPDIANYGLRQAARSFADIWAYPGTRFWRDQRDKYIKEHANDWQTVFVLLQRSLDDARSECQVQKERHDVFLAHELEDRLTTYIAELRDVVTCAGAIVTAVQVVRERETAAVEAVRKVWQGTQGVRRLVDRRGTHLDEDDRSLAGDWARQWRDSGGSDYWITGAMESARCAELVALDIYRELYGEVEDLSILQKVAPISDPRWQTADIDAAGRWIDVKNARRSFSSRNSYSEHCVKRFKSGQGNRQVVVSGFLSPYLTDGGIGTGEQVVWPGETTLEIIKSLRDQFETDYLQLNFYSKWTSRIPPWLFEYPRECYAERDAALVSGRSHRFNLPRSDCPLGFLLLTSRVEPSFPEGPLSEEVLALTRRIGAGSTPTRPMLFLHVLDRFCRTARDEVPFPSEALRQILFSAGPHSLSECTHDTTPLAVLDPLETVKELLDVLGRVAECCARRAVAFTSFRLAGAGVFQGRCSDGTWQTIFAYCGGWRKLPNGGKVKCGQSPLFLGQDDPCDGRGKLVCHMCGYCSESEICPRCSPRQAGWPAS
jgi:hypothetical protein